MPGRNDSAAQPIAPGIIAQIAQGIRQAATGFAGLFFPPGQPQQPSAPAGATPARQWDYPYGVNIYHGPRVGVPISFEQLRMMGHSLDVMRLVIETRKDQMAKLKWQLKLRRLPGEAKADYQKRQDADPRIGAMSQFLERPDRENDWHSWMRMLLEDMFVIDAATVYRRRTKSGATYALEVLDGATIKPLIDETGRRPAFPAPAYEQWIKGVPAWDFTTEDILYRPRNPSVDRFYGYSPVEQVLITANIAIRRMAMQLGHYVDGNIPTALLKVPDTWTPEQIQRAQKFMDMLLAGNLENRAKAIFIPNCEPVWPQKDILKDEFDEWLARVICYAFSVPPTPFIKQMNRSTSENQMEEAMSEGLFPLMEWFEGVMAHIIREWFGYPDIVFAFADDQGSDPASQAAIDKIYLSTGVYAINDVRARLGLDPVAGGDEPGFITAQGFVPLSEAIATAQANTKAAQNPQPAMVIGGAAPKSEHDKDDDDEPPPRKKGAKKMTAAEVLRFLERRVY